MKDQTIEQQQLLAAYCRNGVDVEILGTTDGRLHNYRRLVFNVVRDALSSTYPLTYNLLEINEWEDLCKSFFSDHKCQDPQVWRMPFELIKYVQEFKVDLTKKYPQLIELLHFEWLEVEYYMMPDQKFPEEKTIDLWTSPWQLNPESEIMHLTYPVHLKNARFISRSDQGMYFCLIYRQPDTFKVKFLNLSPFFAWLLSRVKDSSVALSEMGQEIEDAFNISDPEALKENIRPFFEKLVADGMVVT